MNEELSKLKPNAFKLVQLKKKKLLIINHRESFIAIDNKCPHQGAPLHKEGQIQDGQLLCCRHNMRFPLEKGKGTLPLSFYETEVREDGLYIKL